MRDILVDCQAEGYRQHTQRLVSKTQAAVSNQRCGACASRRHRNDVTNTKHCGRAGMLLGRTRARSTRPLTLGGLADFFLTAWPLVEVLEADFDDDLDEALRFFTASSDFYADFDLLCRRRRRRGARRLADDPPRLGSARVAPDDARLRRICARLNVLEMAAHDLPRHFGAWCQSRMGRRPAYVSFLPNALHPVRGIAANFATWAMHRAHRADAMLAAMGVETG